MMANIIDFYEQSHDDAKAQSVRQAWFTSLRGRFGADSSAYAAVLASQGLSLLKKKRWTDAEPLHRDCLSIREKNQPADWMTASTKSMLGEALAGEKNYEGALPLLLTGYNELKDRESLIPASGKPRLSEAARRLAQFCDSTGNSEKANEWRKKAATLAGESPSGP